MRVADWIITYLRDIGIKRVYVVYGAANGDLIDAFTRVDGIEYICPMHEQAASFMAEAEAKITGKLACMIVTSGPGGHNLVTGIADCYYDSVPVLFITGQVNSQFLKGNMPVRQVGFQETDIVEIVKPITKRALQAKTPKAAQAYLLLLCGIAQNARPGPVLLDIPIDIQKAEIDV